MIVGSIGQGNQDRVQRLTTDGLALAFIIVALFSIVGLATIDPVFRMLGATDQTLPLIRQYMTIWYVGVCFVIIPMTGNAAIRATGDMKTPAAIMMTAAAINVVLDPLMIFGIGPFPAMGIQGAALATMIARAMSLAASLWVLIRREQMVTIARPRLSETLDSCERSCSLESPPREPSCSFLSLRLSSPGWLRPTAPLPLPVSASPRGSRRSASAS